MHGKAICFLHLSNEGNIKASIFLILLKCIVVAYFNGNVSFTGRLFKVRAVEYAIPFLFYFILFYFIWYLIYSVFHEAFVKKFMKKLSFFSSNLKNPFGAVFSETKRCWHFEFLWIKYVGNDFSFLIERHLWVYY